MPFPFAGGSGRSTPPQFAPPSLEKYPRIGSRKISFDPPASTEGRDGSIATNVSLCGPHSFDTLTFAPAFTEGCPLQLSAPWAARYWYLSHHVGLSGLLVWAKSGTAEARQSAAATVVARKRAMGSAPFGQRQRRMNSGLREPVAGTHRRGVHRSRRTRHGEAANAIEGLTIPRPPCAHDLRGGVLTRHGRDSRHRRVCDQVHRSERVPFVRRCEQPGAG